MHRLRMLLWHGHVIWVGEGLEIAPHTHVAHQLSVGLDRQFAHETGHGEVVRGHGFICPSGVPHGFRSEASERQVLFWIEPHTWEGRQVAARFPKDRISVLSESDVEQLREVLKGFDLMTCGPAQAERARDACYRAIFGPTPSKSSVDERVTRATEFYFQNRARDTTVAEVACHVALSEAHFSRLFSRTMGVSPTRYRLWMRALEGARLVLDGQSITAAAHGAGFSDAAHFTRTYNRLIGSGGPRANIANMEVVICDERWLTHQP